MIKNKYKKKIKNILFADSLSANFVVLLFFIFIFLIQFLYNTFEYNFSDINIIANKFNSIFIRSLISSGFILIFTIFFILTISRFSKTIKYFLYPIYFLLGLFLSVFWMLDVAILYFTGMHFNPSAVEHASGAYNVIVNSQSILYFFGLSITLFIWFLFGKKFANFNRLKIIPEKILILLIFFLLFLIINFSLLTKISEFNVVKNFIRHYSSSTQVNIDKDIIKKLEEFGIFNNYNNYIVSAIRPAFFNKESLINTDLKNKKLNLIILFLESFNADLTGVYNDNYKELTPGLLEFSENSNTIVFDNHYGVSSPTVTGILSQICSFLPPTGHREINKLRITGFKLNCLPEILKNNGYSTLYVVSGEIDYAHKDTIFKSSGVDILIGQHYLQNIINDQPKSWGYSDHQLFPAFFKIIKNQPEPFLAMFSTIDTHPPFNLSKDQMKYKNGDNDVLNSIYTSDDAFKVFWQNFKNSDLYNNTIIVAVADHSMFPGKDTEKEYDNIGRKLMFYDQNLLAVYIPQNILPKKIETYSSGIDLAPTLLNILNINASTTFDGYSIFGDRKKYPNILGMNDMALYINQENLDGSRDIRYIDFVNLNCINSSNKNPNQLSLCELNTYYNWKKDKFFSGRLYNYIIN